MVALLVFIMATTMASFGLKNKNYHVDKGRDPFNQNSDRSDREKRTTSKGGPVFSKLFRLDRTDPLSFGPKFPLILVEWIAPKRTPKIIRLAQALGLATSSIY